MQVRLTLNPLKHLLRLIIIAVIICSCSCYSLRYYLLFAVLERFHCLIELFNQIRWFG